MSKLFVEINNPITRDYREDKDWGDWQRVSSYQGIRVHDGSYSQEGANYRNSLDVDFETTPGTVVYPVVVVYGTGDTFGHSSGEVTLVDVFDDAYKARGLEDAIRDNSRKGAYTFNYEGKEYYASWEGYFETLERVIVETEVIRA